MKKVTVVDHHLCNLYSVERACEHVGAHVTITDQPDIISQSECLIIPGVGAFGQGMDNIRRMGLLGPILKCADNGIPILGICLGMQFLMDWSEELGMHEGLKLIEGSVNLLSDTWKDDVHYKIPHIGWNKINISKKFLHWDDSILQGIGNDDYFYFVHSFGVFPAGHEQVLATTKYGDNQFCSLIKKNKIYGCQFHPERSGEAGLKLLRNFLTLS